MIPSLAKNHPHTSTGANSRRQRIVSAARRHFFTHGFRSVSMDDLAAELGMSKKTLYAHFPGKDALVEAVILGKFRDVGGKMERITSGRTPDFPSALQKLLVCVQNEISEIQPPFLRDLRREGAGMFKLVEEHRRNLIRRHFGKLFRAGRQSGIVRKDIPASLLIEILLGAIQAIMNPPKLAELKLPPKTGFSAIISVVLEGIVTSKGRSGL